MENFEALQNMDGFCRVNVKKTPENDSRSSKQPSDELLFHQRILNGHQSAISPKGGFITLPTAEDPLVDVIDEEDHIRILVQCRCREQQVTFHPSPDGLRICREECHIDADGTETCNDVCRNVSLRTDCLQIENMQFIIAKCNNNNTLEAMIPKIKR